MLAYERILLATDCSRGNHRVAQKALEVAHRYQAHLDVVYVIEQTPMIHGGGEFALSPTLGIQDMLAKQAKKMLAKFCEHTGLASATQHVVEGSATSSILELVTQLKIQLIILGGHRGHGYSFLSGGHAQGILQRADCDVLLVRLSD